jgi:tetratricopeptide (TPR) repeat protein
MDTGNNGFSQLITRKIDAIGSKRSNNERRGKRRSAMSNAVNDRSKAPLWSTYVANALQAYECGDYSEAEQHIKDSLSRIQSGIIMERAVAAELNYLLANVHRDRDNFPEADAKYETAVEMAKTVAGGTSTELIRILRDQALSLCMQGKFEQAAQLEEKALALAKTKVKRHLFEVSFSLVRLCALYNLARRYDRAEYFYTTYLSQLEETLGKTHNALIPVLCDLGRISYRLQKYRQSEKCYQRALDLIKASGTSYDQLPELLNALGQSLCAQTRQSEAQLLCAKASAMRDASSHTETAEDTIQNLADTYCAHNRFVEAAELCEEASLARETGSSASTDQLVNLLQMYVSYLKRLNSCENTDRIEQRITRLSAPKQ